MGKMTGFLDYGREVSAETAARDRIKNWNEFHTPLSGEEQRKQGARCIECGIPFCQSGVMMKGMVKMCIRDRYICDALSISRITGKYMENIAVDMYV